jgi:hypothetical protein
MKALRSQLIKKNLGDNEETMRLKSNSLQLNWFTELKLRNNLIKLKVKYKMKNLFLNVDLNASSKLVTTMSLDSLKNLESH